MCLQYLAFQVLLEVSVEQCCEHCSSRPRCDSINYQRRFKLCELNDNATMDGQTLDLVEDSEYVFANVQVSMSLIKQYKYIYIYDIIIENYSKWVYIWRVGQFTQIFMQIRMGSFNFCPIIFSLRRYFTGCNQSLFPLYLYYTFMETN